MGKKSGLQQASLCCCPGATLGGYMEKQQMLYHKDVAQWCFAGDVEPRTQQHKSTYGFKSIKLLM